MFAIPAEHFSRIQAVVSQISQAAGAPENVIQYLADKGFPKNRNVTTCEHALCSQYEKVVVESMEAEALAEA